MDSTLAQRYYQSLLSDGLVENRVFAAYLGDTIALSFARLLVRSQAAADVGRLWAASPR